MSDAKGFKFSLKVMVNREKTKVLFAEADSDFVDVLLSFLTLPLGKIVRLLQKHYRHTAPVMGKLTNLYQGLNYLGSVHFWSEGDKEMLLNPKSSFEAECLKLKLNLDDDTQPAEFVTCGDKNCKRKRSPVESKQYDPRKCICVKLESKTQDGNKSDGGVFTQKTVSFLISDDLRVLPNVPGSVVQTLANLGITDVDGAELRIVTFGFNEIMGLLWRSLLTGTPLTDVVMYEHASLYQICLGMLERFLRRNSLQRIKKESTSGSKKMTVKVILKKSTNKLLFAQAEEDFVDFLFSLLVIPLGGVESLLGSDTALGPIDNLYKSIANISKYLINKETKNRLLKPALPPMYKSKNLMFPLTEQSSPNPPKVEQSYVKKPGMFMVTDDLTVTPLSVTSTISVLNKMSIPLSDVKEMELHVGLTEALSLLKASLSSFTALTDGLINPIIK